MESYAKSGTKSNQMSMPMKCYRLWTNWASDFNLMFADYSALSARGSSIVPFFCSLKHMDKQVIPSLPIVRDVVWVGVGSIEHGIQRMIVKQELFDGKHMGCLEIDGNLIGWLAHQHHCLLLTTCIDDEEQFVMIHLRGHTPVPLCCAVEECILVDDHIQNMLDFARGKLRSPQGITWVCSKNERSVSIEGPHRHCVHLCSLMLREFGELHEDVI